jgi:hypothetical protein
MILMPGRREVSGNTLQTSHKDKMIVIGETVCRQTASTVS